MLNPHLQVILPPKNIVVIQQKESTESFNALFSKGSVYIYCQPTQWHRNLYKTRFPQV